MIRLANVTKVYNAGKANRFTAVDGISLDIPALKLTVLKGPSGSGKTTLLSLIGCMVRPTSGRIGLHGIRTTFAPNLEDIDQLDITSLPERFLTEIRRTTFGFVFQQFNLVKGISVLENILLPAYPTGESHATFRKRGLALLEQFGMQRHATSRVEWLSGGELQRVAIARALINDPAVIIADEPTAHLDSSLSQEFMEIVGTMKSAGKTILIASHDPIVYDAKIADSVVEMRDGRITAIREAG
jgi:putative ABC transport system ATP-binding protein